MVKRGGKKVPRNPVKVPAKFTTTPRLKRSTRLVYPRSMATVERRSTKSNVRDVKREANRFTSRVKRLSITPRLSAKCDR